MLIQSFGRLHLSIVLLFLFPFNLFSESIWTKGTVVTKRGYILDGEYTTHSTGIYLRQDGVGKQIGNDEIESIVNLEYVRKVENSSPELSAFESFYYFNASAKYRYYGKNEIDHQDKLALASKITSLAFSIYFFQIL
ncbi:hypothetical protein EHQ24_05400 [Leptospira noumeaensis]|uniref:Uncharacterized protein n=1 Tax=Leptospira noumeaensis TaxID=2484964 RepID=A0A4R9IFE9_9LEPT|nr:hypothetical protein [Leptospira noumeaensis]TGK87029.1 hypothetical protein EHQ24_05400 [Leptospira noumeaensis]